MDNEKKAEDLYRQWAGIHGTTSIDQSRDGFLAILFAVNQYESDIELLKQEHAEFLAGEDV